MLADETSKCVIKSDTPHAQYDAAINSPQRELKLFAEGGSMHVSADNMSIPACQGEMRPAVHSKSA